MKHQYKDGTLYFYFYGDLDNLTVCNLKQICIDLIEEYKPKIVKLDFEEVTFVDSTGIGFVLARFKTITKNEQQTDFMQSIGRKQSSISDVRYFSDYAA